MKLIFLSLVVLLTLNLSAEYMSTEKLKQGNMSIGGTAGIGFSTYSGINLVLNPVAQYFIMDDFALGGEIGLSISERHSLIEIGPSLTYYLLYTNETNWYVSESLLYGQKSISDKNISRASSYIVSRSKLGFNYLFSNSFGIGPSVQFTHYFGLPSKAENYGFENNTLSLGASAVYYF